MLLVKLMHGLGNQMFQYAFGRSLEHKTGQPVKFHLGWYDVSKGWRDSSGQSEGCSIRDYTLQVFPNICMNIASKEEISSIENRSYGKGRQAVAKIAKKLGIYSFLRYFLGYYRIPKWYSSYEQEMFDVSLAKDYCFEGFFQNELYFTSIADQIRDAFTFPAIDDEFNMTWKIRIEDEPDSVCIHVRQGDYVSLGYALPLSYYETAVHMMRERLKSPHFFMFGNGAGNVAKQLFPSGHDYYDVVPGENAVQKQDYRDMQLMSLCNNFIIANSTFSWWAAWLATYTDKVVMAPQPFMHGHSDIICKSWQPIVY